VLTALEKRHRSLLIRERDALESLNDRAGHTLHEVVRRLDKLDEEYGFIRTSIFWVRDQEPMGVETLSQQVRECHYLANGLVRLAREWINDKLWSSPSAEFMATALAGFVLPIGLGRLRKLLRVWIERDLPTP
jgi:potassium efflux system protein